MINDLANQKITLAETTDTFRRRRRLPKSLVWGMVLMGILIMAVVFIPIIHPVNPNAQDLQHRFAASSIAHPFGTDNYGRDIFTRILVGGRVDIEIAIFATLISLIVGTVAGLFAGYFGGWVDIILMRLVDITISFPMIVLVIAIVAMLGTGVINMYIAIVVISWVFYARLTRGECLVVKNKEYVQAVRALGGSNTTIIFRHIFPNVVSGVVVYAASDAVLNIIFAGTLGYLGLGIQPPDPEWGSMVAASQQYLKEYPWLLIYPSIAVIIAGIAFSLIGDGLADAMRRSNYTA